MTNVILFIFISCGSMFSFSIYFQLLVPLKIKVKGTNQPYSNDVVMTN